MPSPSVQLIADRLRARDSLVLPRNEHTRTAAVAAIVRDSGDDAEVLLIRRAEHPNDPWSGQMAFPGGRNEPRDVDLLATALRETSEEIGVDLLEVARPLGHLDEVEATVRGRMTGLIVRPYVFQMRADADLRVRENYEVAEVVWGRLGPMLRGETKSTIHYTGQGYDVTLPAYDVDGRTVWGLTYQMLHSLFDRLR